MSVNFLEQAASGLPSASATAARPGRTKAAVDKTRSEQREAALASMDEILGEYGGQIQSRVGPKTTTNGSRIGRLWNGDHPKWYG